jgi:hypothetical protein
MGEEALLGEATLAKLSVTRKVVGMVEAPTAVTTETPVVDAAAAVTDATIAAETADSASEAKPEVSGADGTESPAS